MKRKTGLKDSLKKGKVVYGPWCVIPSPSTINVIAAAGVDFVIIDMEHGPHSFETAEDMIRAAEVEGCTAIVRVAKNDESLILSALDIGAAGVIVPHIESRQDAEEAISYAKYFPVGERGFSPFTRAGGYSLNDVRDHAVKQNGKTMIILLLEGKGGVNNLDDILSIKDIRKKIDVIYIGAYDLSQAIGYPGQVDHPEVRKQLEACIKKIRGKGIAAGGYVAKNDSDIRWMTELGMQFITLMPDCTILFHAFESFYKTAFAKERQ
ncbi:MAG: 4-hydroxy-2-oxo-heptane-1,7-dioate aldolase [Syntrophorhabdus sp. PtaU1.Bin058]|nr:MAG: 4-hydroxy-2-oxo-heptane-1,7-dioate aldolase [Syntrophorhabdus sp. PtaU1.Bin058]